MVCISHHVQLACKAIDLVHEALADGRLSKKELSASTEKILLAKSMLAEQERIDFSVVGCAEHKQRNQELVEKSLCLVNDQNFQMGDKPLFVAPRLFNATYVSNMQDSLSFAPEMEKLLGGGSIVLSDNPQEEELEDVARKASFYTSVIVGTYNGHIYRGQLNLVEKLAKLGIPICAIALRNPYDLAHIPQSVQSYATFAYRREVLEALAKVLTGNLVPTGKLPVKL